MAKAVVTLPTGTKVTVEGTPDEVQRIVRSMSGSSHQPSQPHPGAKVKPIRGSRVGPTDRVRTLKQEGFFREKRLLDVVVKKLAEKGHIYEQDDLSPVMVRLTRLGELRRVREKDGWAYVNP